MRRQRVPVQRSGDAPLQRRVPILVSWTVYEAVRRDPAVLPVVPQAEGGAPNRGTDIERRGKDDKAGNHKEVLATRERPRVGSGADRIAHGPHRGVDRAFPGSSQGPSQPPRTPENGWPAPSTAELPPQDGSRPLPDGHRGARATPLRRRPAPGIPPSPPRALARRAPPRTSSRIPTRVPSRTGALNRRSRCKVEKTHHERTAV